MPTHDMIDNHEEVLLEHVKNLLRNLVKQIERTKKQGWLKKGMKG